MLIASVKLYACMPGSVTLITFHAHYGEHIMLIKAKKTFQLFNPSPAKAFVPFVKISTKNRLSQKFCWPEVFILKTLLQFGVHEKWELKQEVIQRNTDMQKPLL